MRDFSTNDFFVHKKTFKVFYKEKLFDDVLQFALTTVLLTISLDD